jgi:hypothetical protein
VGAGGLGIRGRLYSSCRSVADRLAQFLGENFSGGIGQNAECRMEKEKCEMQGGRDVRDGKDVG